MKISISTQGLYPAKIDNILDFLTKQKLEYLEIVKEYPYYDITLDDIASYDIKLSIHSPFSDINIASHIDSIRNASIKEVENSFIKANQLDVNRVVVHPGSISQLALNFTDKILEYNNNSLIECQQLAQEYGVMMCVENMPLVDSLLYSNIEALFDFVDNTLHSGITMDVGHANTMGFSIEDMFNNDNIHHVHLSDNDGSSDMHGALGSYDIDFNKIFDVLNKKKYDEICVVEVKSLNNVYKSLDYLKSIGIL